MSIQKGQNIFNILCQENGYLNIRGELWLLDFLITTVSYNTKSIFSKNNVMKIFHNRYIILNFA